MRMLVLPAPRRSRVLRAAALALVALGYADLVRGGITAAPLLLVAGYLVLVPIAILLD
jgi:hypothetical protein